ncbi:hypothetical protein SAMN04487857_103304 [Pseudomonas sp. ok272]|nr:hypothetical protein [Pseudomonas sp. ok272]SEM63044.1 hypothetical protein SAMN04487857_103304 [Pseudomonas sp. ok272]SFM47044.1 hypothetical protein SAMN04487858_103131 [Pseudomonas sp. ok602]
MTLYRRLKASRRSLLLSGGLALLLLVLGTLWLNFKPGAKLEGRYSSSGQMQLRNGHVIDVSHNVRFSNGRFYAMTRQGSSILASSGSIEYGFFGRYRLLVEKGELIGLTEESDDEQVFNLLYGRQKGSSINLVPIHECLYGLETRQIYCAVNTAESL